MLYAHWVCCKVGKQNFAKKLFCTKILFISHKNITAVYVKTVDNSQTTYMKQNKQI